MNVENVISDIRDLIEDLEEKNDELTEELTTLREAVKALLGASNLRCNPRLLFIDLSPGSDGREALETLWRC